jgi:hypothetical protein
MFEEPMTPREHVPGFTRLMTGKQVLAAITDELRAMPEPMVVAFQPVAMFHIAGLLQIALRHPQVSAEVRLAGGRFLTDIREYFATCPTVLDLLAQMDEARERNWS